MSKILNSFSHVSKTPFSTRDSTRKKSLCRIRVENSTRENKLQSISFPTFTVPADGRYGITDYHPLNQFGSIQVFEYLTAESERVSAEVENAYLEINLIFTIQAERRIGLDTLFGITNQFGILNFTDRVHGEFVDSRATIPLAVQKEIDILPKIRYTFQALVTGNIMGIRCFGEGYFEFTAGLGY